MPCILCVHQGVGYLPRNATSLKLYKARTNTFHWYVMQTKIQNMKTLQALIIRNTYHPTFVEYSILSLNIYTALRTFFCLCTYMKSISRRSRANKLLSLLLHGCMKGNKAELLTRRDMKSKYWMSASIGFVSSFSFDFKTLVWFICISYSFRWWCVISMFLSSYGWRICLDFLRKKLQIRRWKRIGLCTTDWEISHVYS